MPTIKRKLIELGPKLLKIEKHLKDHPLFFIIFFFVGQTISGGKKEIVSIVFGRLWFILAVFGNGELDIWARPNVSTIVLMYNWY
jgi:hypothetical protein